jgi:3-isopropylmalate dehydrogenase
MLLRHSFNLEAEAASVESAVDEALTAGHRTRDLAKSGQSSLGTREMGRMIVDAVEQHAQTKTKS